MKSMAKKWVVGLSLIFLSLGCNKNQVKQAASPQGPSAQVAFLPQNTQLLPQKQVTYLCVISKVQNKGVARRGDFLYMRFPYKGQIPARVHKLVGETVRFAPDLAKKDTMGLSVSLGNKGQLAADFVPGIQKTVTLSSSGATAEWSLVCELLEEHVPPR